MMTGKCALVVMVVSMLSAGISHGADRVEIVIDNSASMWGKLGDGPPRLVAIREALQGFAVSLDSSREAPELGLRAIGGKTGLEEGETCGNTAILVKIGAIDFDAWHTALAGLEPRGERGLVTAAVEAVADLGQAAGRRRIVIITAGDDECHGNFRDLSAALGEGEGAVEVRIIGLGLRGTAANNFTLFAPTRNVSDLAGLVNALRWAVLPSDARPASDQLLEMHLTRGGEAVDGTEVRVVNQASGETTTAELQGGAMRIRLPPGRYRAMVDESGGQTLELAGLTVAGEGGAFDIDLSPTPPVTLDVDPEKPQAGGTVFVQFWGAPIESSWVTLAPVGAPLGEYLLRAPISGPSGEVAFRLPGELLEFEARCVHEPRRGVSHLLGRLAFESRLGIATLEIPEKAENRMSLSISWTGPDLPGDHITITPAGGENDDHTACVFTGIGSPIHLAAPVIPGDYWVRYHSSGGRVLARAALEVYEVLAILDGPGEVSPGEEFTVSWEGPDANQDHLTLASADAANDEYLSWSPTAVGPSLQLRAPAQVGHYELRYVRAADGEVLARAPIAVVATAIALRAPEEVDAGSRFAVEWSGTAGEGDFLAVAPRGAGPRRHLDWSYTVEGNQLSLAAPFKPGAYEVRYVSGADLEILASAPLLVR